MPASREPLMMERVRSSSGADAPPTLPHPRAASTAMVAAFSCPETERLGRLLGSPVAVIAVTGDPAAHALRMSSTWHAAWGACEGLWAAFDYGLAGQVDVCYAHSPFDGRWLGGAELSGGLALAGGCIEVALPQGCCAADLAAMFAMAMSERRFCAVASRPSSVRRRYGTGRPANLGPRYALARPGDFGRVVLVEDLYAFRPRDLPAVAAAAAMAANGLAIRALLSRPEEAA